MEKTIKLHNKTVVYKLKTSRRAKRMRLAVYCDGSFVVTKPYGVRNELVDNFLKDRANWVLEKLEYFKSLSGLGIFRNDEAHYQKHAKEALEFAMQKVEKLNKFYNFSYNKINVKNQKTRWGSCSQKRNLNFNYKILFLPEKLAEYVIVHEICHLQEFNHSRKFWNLVSVAIPNYDEIRKELGSKLG